MKTKLFLLLLSVAIFVGCQTAPSPDAEEEEEPKMTYTDSLLRQVIDGHDVAMPKMFKLERLQKDLNGKIDSLKKTSANKESIASLETVVKKLSEADADMHAWMEGFSYDTLKDNEQQRIAYLKGQLESVNKMKDKVLGSIAYADSVLGNKE